MTSVAVDRIPRTSDGTPLKLKLQRAERRRKLRAVGLVLPLFAFIVVAFIFPIGVMLFNAVHDDSLATILPRTTTTLRDWDGKDLPGEAAYAALVEDLKQGWKDRTVAEAGKRMNYELPGARSEVMASGREASKLTAGPYKQAMIAISPIWGKRGTWAILKRGASDYTAYYLMRSLDYQYNDNGQIVATPPETAIFRNIFIRTLGISIGVTVATLLLGFPVAYLLASLPLRTSNLLMIMVLLPFWTSLLVRTTAWVVLLQQHGVINDVLMALHVISQPAELIFNPPSHVRAARSLGAGPFYAFWRVYFPQTLPGIGAGCLLTFILCLGYYITPALVGGPTDQMISYFVARYTNLELNWGMASALGAILLAATVILYYVYNKLIGIDRIKLG